MMGIQNTGSALSGTGELQAPHPPLTFYQSVTKKLFHYNEPLTVAAAGFELRAKGFTV